LAVSVGRDWLTSDNALGVSFEIAEGLLGWWGCEAYVASKGNDLVRFFPVLEKSPAQQRSVVIVAPTEILRFAGVIEQIVITQPKRII